MKKEIPNNSTEVAGPYEQPKELILLNGIEQTPIFKYNNTSVSRMGSAQKKFTAGEIPGRLPLSEIGSMMDSH
jgi:hypothetical protein